MHHSLYPCCHCDTMMTVVTPCTPNANNPPSHNPTDETHPFNDFQDHLYSAPINHIRSSSPMHNAIPDSHPRNDPYITNTSISTHQASMTGCKQEDRPTTPNPGHWQQITPSQKISPLQTKEMFMSPMCWRAFNKPSSHFTMTSPKLPNKPMCY